MANTAITPANLTAFRKATDMAVVAATASVADTPETFEFVATGKPFILLATVANSHGSVALSMNVGDTWAGKATTIGAAVENKTTAFYVESGYGLNDAGKIEIVATPATGKILLTNHALKLSVIQL